jgi:hypothetical protein
VATANIKAPHAVPKQKQSKNFAHCIDIYLV